MRAFLRSTMGIACRAQLNGWRNKAPANQPLAPLIICARATLSATSQAGFGKLDVHALERSGGGAQSLLNAQSAAKAAKAGVWSIEPTEAELKVPQAFVLCRISIVASLSLSLPSSLPHPRFQWPGGLLFFFRLHLTFSCTVVVAPFRLLLLLRNQSAFPCTLMMS